MGDKVGKGTSALIEALPSLKEDHHVVMVGLDSAGKSTVLYRLKFDQYVNTVPTIGFNCERVRGSYGRSRGLTFLIWDVGGQEKVRPLWKSYTRATDAVIFVVDSTDVERLEEAKLELHRIMRTPDNVGVPLLVIANKQVCMEIPNFKILLRKVPKFYHHSCYQKRTFARPWNLIRIPYPTHAYRNAFEKLY